MDILRKKMCFFYWMKLECLLKIHGINSSVYPEIFGKVDKFKP